MNYRYFNPAVLIIGFTAIATTNIVAMAAPPVTIFDWLTVVNNGVNVPGTDKPYNSYNQPSVNSQGLVVFRARSRGPQRESGIYTRQMPNGDINTIANLNTTVPYPNDTSVPFIEFPSIPRIAIDTNAIATRGNHQSVLEGEGKTTGIYVKYPDTSPFTSPLLTAASKLGDVPQFSFFAVPGAVSGTIFDVFPGSPAITNDGTIGFKGNYTEDSIAKTGVFYRQLANEVTGGESPVQLIANSDTEIPFLPPGISKKFGSFDSTSPPSAAAGKAVFVGLDNEANPSYGGIYEAPLDPDKVSDDLSPLTLLIGLGTRVPSLTGPSFSRLGEGLSYDGRFVAFWGAWGAASKTVRLYCPEEGNKERIAYCKSSESGSTFDPASNNWYQEKTVPINQGIFVLDTQTQQIRMVARTNRDFDDFVYWNFSGRVTGSEEGDDGEPARWRSSAFSAVSGNSVAFKARTGNIDRTTHVYANPVDGIYLQRDGASPLETVVDTTMSGQTLDSNANANNLTISEVGIERDGFRQRNLVINARMGSEESGWGGIYLTSVGNP